MNRYFLAAAAVFVWLGATLAQAQTPTPTAIATARELVETKGGSAMFDPVIVSMVEQTKGALIQTNPQLAKDLSDVAVQLRTEFESRKDELMNQAARFYAERFSEQELKDVLAFYKSPLGKKMLTVEPQVLDQTFNFIQQWGQRTSEEVMSRFRAEMKKKGHTI